MAKKKEIKQEEPKGEIVKAFTKRTPSKSEYTLRAGELEGVITIADDKVETIRIVRADSIAPIFWTYAAYDVRATIQIMRRIVAIHDACEVLKG